MIYIITAMYAEAHPFITRFQLKKDISHTRFQVFFNNGLPGQEADLCLIISGTGMIPAATALSSICTEYGVGHEKQGDFLLNVGVCGQIWNKNVSGAENSCQTGKLFLCNKIKEQITGRTFYPDILFRHSFAEAPILTGPKPYEKNTPVNIEETDFFLYDMEASAIYQAGSCFFGPHRMSFLKVVSDDGNAGRVTSEQIGNLIAGNMGFLTDYIKDLQVIAREERQADLFQEKSLQENWDKLCCDLHCSRTMSESLRQHLRYCILSGIDYTSVLEEMYRTGKLPCRDKREGKQCFEELKERLL